MIQADAKIQSITAYDEMDGIEIPKKMKVAGRGGTDFRPVFAWIDENAPRSNLIYATDGFGDFPVSTHVGDVIWLLVKHHKAISEFPLGRCLKL